MHVRWLPFYFLQQAQSHVAPEQQQPFAQQGQPSGQQAQQAASPRRWVEFVVTSFMVVPL
jgi:hypothetical protein